MLSVTSWTAMLSLSSWTAMLSVTSWTAYLTKLFQVLSKVKQVIIVAAEEHMSGRSGG